MRVTGYEPPPVAEFEDPDDHGGRRVVATAPDLIHLDVEAASKLLQRMGAADPIEVLPDGVVVLDSAGEYRYRLVEVDRRQRSVGVYERE